MRYTHSLVGLTLCLTLAISVGAQPHDNILVIVVDDLGADNLCEFRGGLPCNAGVPLTPEIDLLIGQGVRFSNAWSNPVCSTTRASIQTGQYSRRTNVGGTVEGAGEDNLQPTAWTLAQMLDDAEVGYTTAAFGKWHLSNDAEFEADPPAPVDPEIGGFDVFQGTAANLERNGTGYCSYEWWDFDGVQPEDSEQKTFYATSQVTNSALSWISANRDKQPWMVYMAYHAPHDPFHDPQPIGAVIGPTGRSRTIYRCRPCDEGLTDDDCATEMIEVLDTEIGYLADVLGDFDADVDEVTFPTILFISDNGSHPDIVDAAFDPGRNQSKGTVYNSGVRVPMFASQGQVTAAGTVVDFANTTDAFATVADLAGVVGLEALADQAGVTGLDSVSLMPYLLGGDCAGGPCRDFQFAEIFDDAPVLSDALAFRTATPGLEDLKLIRQCSGCAQFPNGCGSCPENTQCIYDTPSEQVQVTNRPLDLAAMADLLDAHLFSLDEVCPVGQFDCAWCPATPEDFCLVRCEDLPQAGTRVE